MDRVLQDRYEDFWNRKGACVAIEAPKADFTPKPARDVEQKWQDSSFILENFLRRISATGFYGDGFPSLFVNHGPGVLAAFLGNPYQLADDTVWFDTDPMIKDMEHPPSLSFNMKNPVYHLIHTMTEQYLSQSGGRYITSITDIGGSLDVIAALRGTESLLYDLYDYPEKVHFLMDELEKIWEACFTALYRLLQEHQSGMTSWMPIWSDQQWYPLQCDFCAMLSPALFEEFVLPYLNRQANFLGRAIYHLDGPGELPHLDYILEIEKINAIQWTAGAGNADIGSSDWYELYHKMQQKGKGIVLLGVQPGDVTRLLRELEPGGLYLSTACDTPDEAKRLEEEVSKILLR